MKKYIFLSLAALSLASCASLPTPAKDFVSKHFPATPVVNVEREDDFRGYSAELSDRTEIEFTKEGDWIQVDAEDGNMLPATFFPENIAAYAQQNGWIIDGIRKTNVGYKVEFTGNIPDGFFDQNGNLKSGAGMQPNTPQNNVNQNNTDLQTMP